MKKAKTEEGAEESETGLSADEKKQLLELEDKIQKHVRSNFIEVGAALSEICSGALYKEVNKSFDTYCVSRWGFSGSHARRLMEASDFVKKLRSKKVSDEHLPATEFQVRLVFERRKPMHRVPSWRKMVKSAEKEKKQLTAGYIRQYLGDGSSKTGQKPKVKKNGKKESDVQEKALSLIKQKRDAIDEMSKSDWETFLDELENLLAAA